MMADSKVASSADMMVLSSAGLLDHSKAEWTAALMVVMSVAVSVDTKADSKVDSSVDWMELPSVGTTVVLSDYPMVETMDGRWADMTADSWDTPSVER